MLNENIENKKIGYQILFIFVDVSPPLITSINNFLERLSKSTIELS